MNRKDLAVTVEQQKEQIAHYEKKLKDLVRAYKSLLKERDALQTGLNALKSSTQNATPQHLSSTSESASDHESHTSQGKLNYAESSVSKKENDMQPNFSDGEKSTCGVESSIKASSGTGNYDYELKVKQLTNALTEMSSDKERLQKNFLLERKSLTTEQERLQEEMKKLEESRSAAVANSKELRQRLQALQAERTADADDAAVKFRECQRLVSEQREARERAELKVQQLQHKIQQRSSQQKQQAQLEGHNQQQQKQVTELRNVICQLEARISNYEKEENNKAEEIQQLHQLHVAAATSLHQESLRVQDVEAELGRVVAASREREAALEARLAEAMSCVASTGLDSSSSAALRHCQNRVRELTEHNLELSRQLEAVNRSSEVKVKTSADDALVADNQEATYLLKHIKKLLLQLQILNISSAQRKDLEDALGGSDVLHEHCKQEIENLKQQLQQMRRVSDYASSDTCSWHPDAVGGSNEINAGLPEAYKEPMASSGQSCQSPRDVAAELRALRQELRSVKSAAQASETAHLQQIEQLKQECRNLRTECEERLTSAQQSHRAVVCSLEQQLTSQRLHSIATLQERDVELHRLQQQLHSASLDSVQSKVPKALVNTTTAASRSGPLLHHIEELQRREQEVAALQQEKRQLEHVVREVQQAALEKRLQHEDRLAHLEMQLERYDRNQSRESQNLEYLKNVLLHFLTNGEGASVGGRTTTTYGRQAMVKAVAAVLKLTPKEEERLRRHSAAAESWWWWGAGSGHETSKK